jgi:hypothetical protein
MAGVTAPLITMIAGVNGGPISLFVFSIGGGFTTGYNKNRNNDCKRDKRFHLLLLFFV